MEPRSWRELDELARTCEPWRQGGAGAHGEKWGVDL